MDKRLPSVWLTKDLSFSLRKGKGRTYSFMRWEGAVLWSKPQENRLSLRFCRNNVIFLSYWQQLWPGGRYEIILSENISFGPLFKVSTRFPYVNDKINVKNNIEKSHNIYFYVLYEKICKEEIT